MPSGKRNRTLERANMRIRFDGLEFERNQICQKAIGKRSNPSVAFSRRRNTTVTLGRR
jgi:hypothetical protein